MDSKTPVPNAGERRVTRGAGKPVSDCAGSSGAQGTTTALRESVDPLVPTIFHEPWWLDAASGGRYEEVTVKISGREVGRLPYVMEKQFGFPVCVAPELTHFLGPAVDEGLGGEVTRGMRRHQITRDLISQLPHFSFFYQPMHWQTQDALPFVQHDFTILTLFTYEVAPAPEATLWRNMRDKTRNVIRRAQERTEIRDLQPDAFLALYQRNLERRGWFHNHMYSSNAPRILEAAVGRNRGRLLGACDAKGTVSAAIFYIWDHEVTYYILTTRSPDSHNGVVSRLIWEAIRDSASHGRIFDFDGVGTKGSVLFYSAFGGMVRPRFAAERMTRAYRAARFVISRPRQILDNVMRDRGTSGQQALVQTER